MRWHRISALVSVLGMLLLLAGPLAAAPRYYYRNLGTPAGKELSYAYGINAGGVVVGEADQRAFLKDPRQPMQDLGTLGGEASDARAINASGQVVGQAEIEDGSRFAFLKDPGTPMQNLGDLGGGFMSWAYGINAGGQVVGMAANSDLVFRAFLKKPGEPMQDLGTLGGEWSGAYSINTAGQAVGESQTADGLSMAFLKEPDQQTLQPLGTLPGGSSSTAWAINDNGQVAGGADIAGEIWRAFLKNPGLPMQDLGTLGGDTSEARALNNRGQVVGWTYNGDGRRVAFLWENDTMYELNRVTANLPANVTLMEAFAINDQGWIAGVAVVPVSLQAFLLTTTPLGGGNPALWELLLLD